MPDETPPPAPSSPAPEEPGPAPLPEREGGAEPLDWFGTPRPGELREHYRPAAAATRLTLALAPWFDVLLLVVATVLFHVATALVPGQPVEFLAGPAASAGALPDADLHDGARSSLVVVVRALPSPGVRDLRSGSVLRAEAFFRDDRYNLAQESRRNAFRSALAAAVRDSGETTALVYMDGSVPHRDAVRFSALLRDTGLAGASFVTRPETYRTPTARRPE